jgi:hypothetical protein
MEYLGHQVFDAREFIDLKQATPLDLTWIVDRHQLDETHPIERFFRFAFPRHRCEIQLAFKEIIDYASVRDFFKERCGALEPFWYLFPYRVLALAEDLNGGDASIKIASVQYAENFLASQGTFRHVFLSTGSEENARKIVSAVDGDESDTLTLDVPLTLGATAIEDVELYLLFFCRFETDMLTSQWPELVSHAEVAVTIIELMNDYP